VIRLSHQQIDVAAGAQGHIIEGQQRRNGTLERDRVDALGREQVEQTQHLHGQHQVMPGGVEVIRL
jgi:antitoxin component HigA of HigAB toxin-antitoxin module